MLDGRNRAPDDDSVFIRRHGRYTSAVSPALETLLLPFSSEAEQGLAVPQRALFLGAEPHPALKAWPEISGWQPFKPQAVAWDAAGFTRMDAPMGSFPLVLVLPGKSRDDTLALFATAHDHLEDSGILLVSMPNTAGAPRFEKELARAAGEIVSLQKHKCRAFRAVKSPPWDPAVLAEWRALGEVRTLPGTPFLVQAGVFSPDHADPGSVLLASRLPSNLRGKVADLGAGWGFLSRHLLDRCPGIQCLDLYEADARALDLARRNLGEPAAETRFFWSDVAAGLDDTGYDSIVMNPPFHTGQKTDPGLGRAFIRSAAGALKRGGSLYLVANRQLPYEAELDDTGFTWRKAAEDSVFKLLFATKR